MASNTNALLLVTLLLANGLFTTASADNRYPQAYRLEQDLRPSHHHRQGHHKKFRHNRRSVNQHQAHRRPGYDIHHHAPKHRPGHRSQQRRDIWLHLTWLLMHQ